MRLNYTKNVFANCKPLEMTWEDLSSALFEAAQEPRHPSQKDQLDLFGPFSLREGDTKRCIANVAMMSDFAVFDLDVRGWDVCRVTGTLKGFAYIVHTTTNSRLDHARWRIIVRLDREYTIQEQPSVWSCFNDMFSGDLDAATKDVSRIFFFPAKWRRAYNVFKIGSGKTFRLCDILQSRPTGSISLAEPDVISLRATVTSQRRGSIIEQWMIERYLLGVTGKNCGRLFFMLMLAAGRAQRRGITITPDELADAALSAHPAIQVDTRNNVRTRNSVVREAGRAIAAVQRHATQTSSTVEVTHA